MGKHKKTLPRFKHTGDGKKEFVEQMFDDISPHYDFLNHFLSLGVDIYWRKKLVRKLNIKNDTTVLDMACGTGDVGFEILKHYQIQLINMDISGKMLEIAKKKSKEKKMAHIQFIKGDAIEIPLDDSSVDFLTISYGFRNISNHDKALNEFYRVLKPGGCLGILEFSIPKSKFIGQIFKFYFHHILPRIASLFSRSDAYLYLPESVDFFPTRKEICDKIINAGFQKSKFTDLTFGITSIYLGLKNEK